MTFITTKLDSYNIKTVQTMIIYYLLQLIKQITKQNLMFLHLKGKHKLGRQK